LHVVHAKTRLPIAAPLLSSDPQIVHRVTDVLWQYAYARWLATVNVSDPQVTLGGSWNTSAEPCAPVSITAFRPAPKASPTPTAVPSKAAGGFKSRGFKIISKNTPMHGTALRIGDDGTIEPIGGLEAVLGRASSCVEGSGTVRVFGARDPIDLVHAYSTPTSRAERALPVVATKKDERPIGVLEPRTRELLETLDHVSSTSLVRQAVPASR
jgi:hypothetical protein